MSRVSKGYMGLSQRGSILIPLFFVFMVLTVIAGYLANRSGYIKIPSTLSTPNLSIDSIKDKLNISQDKKSKEEEEVKPKMVPFSYKVVSIESDKIVINGRSGDLTLTKDYIQNIYNGNTSDSPTITYEDLKVGNTLNLEYIPGKYANLFVLSI